MVYYKAKDKTLNKMSQVSSKYKRVVGEYKRKLPNNKVQKIESYEQGYNSPRGKIGTLTADNITRRSQTMWLMDRKGHFVGRANYEGNTTAKNISKFGYDDTTVLRDTKRFKRILGRR